MKTAAGHRILLASLVCVLLVVSQGCAASFMTQPANQAIAGSVLFEDNFSNIPSGWGIWEREGALISYYAGGLRILVNEMEHDYWSVAGKNFTDVQIEVDAAKLAGPDDNDFGILCRYMDRDNFYALVISSDGYYGVIKMKSGKYSVIGADQLQYSPAIAQGMAVNHLRADCVGSTLRLWANKTLLTEVGDSDFSSGDVGLLAGAYGNAGVDIFFDNFVVKKPSE